MKELLVTASKMESVILDGEVFPQDKISIHVLIFNQREIPIVIKKKKQSKLYEITKVDDSIEFKHYTSGGTVFLGGGVDGYNDHYQTCSYRRMIAPVDKYLVE